MKKYILTLALGISSLAFSQDYSVPAASPRHKIEHQFSISKVSVDYGRPGVKGREIFGKLVPFNEVWRTGANSSTKITFGQEVSFGGKTVPAGTYALFIVPQAQSWKLILNKDSQQWGAYGYNDKLNVTDIDVPVQKLPQTMEWFTIELNPAKDDQLDMTVEWENSKVVVPIRVAKAEVTNKMIEKLKEAKKIEWDAGKK
ncbi:MULTISPECIES: DUF2911 domain-containing protein [Amniculibacterium]|jgi:hypothetical protein|uniref:DUF2911 domain-containing protein n=1 Tax=Amniculibacterium TaxID=2715289 RepID=UPI000F59DDBE|nr:MULTISPECIES: DUF2911 domain-containing protein [Amniculibacterium]